MLWQTRMRGCTLRSQQSAESTTCDLEMVDSFDDAPVSIGGGGVQVECRGAAAKICACAR